MGCTVPIETGVTDTRTQKCRSARASRMSLPEGQVISLQDLIVANSDVMGEKVTAFAKSLFGDPTCRLFPRSSTTRTQFPITALKKWEVYDINSFDNPESLCLRTIPRPWDLSLVTKDQFLDCMKWQEGLQRIRHLAPHVMMQLITDL